MPRAAGWLLLAAGGVCVCFGGTLLCSAGAVGRWIIGGRLLYLTLLGGLLVAVRLPRPVLLATRLLWSAIAWVLLIESAARPQPDIRLTLAGSALMAMGLALRQTGLLKLCSPPAGYDDT